MQFDPDASFAWAFVQLFWEVSPSKKIYRVLEPSWVLAKSRNTISARQKPFDLANMDDLSFKCFMVHA